MSKDILVLKGGYGAEYGDRVGGIVEVTGIRGNVNKPSLNLNINNMTINGMAGIPINERSVLTLAYRQTYYNLADADNLSRKLRGNKGGKQTDINVYPDYVFRDFNIKYAGSTRSGDAFHLSLYQGKDNFSYEIDQEVAFNNKNCETALKNKNTFFISEHHKMVGGFEYTHSNLLFEADSSSEGQLESQAYGNRLSAFIQDEWRIGQLLLITPGIRVDYPVHLSKLYLQPRISASASISIHAEAVPFTPTIYLNLSF